MRLLGGMMLVAVCAAVPLQAQVRGDGFWYGASAGSGWGRLACEICASGRGTAPAVSVELGGMAGPRLRIGAEAAGWFQQRADVSERLWALSANAYWYPGARSRFFWKAGAGLLAYRNNDGNDLVGSSAFGIHLGAGIEVPVGRRVSLVPAVNVFLANLGGEVSVNGATALEDADLQLVRVGIGVVKR